MYIAGKEGGIFSDISLNFISEKKIKNAMTTFLINRGLRVEKRWKVPADRNFSEAGKTVDRSPGKKGKSE
jgi:hypothetical protein